MVAGIDIGKSSNYVSINQTVKKFKIENLKDMIEYLKTKDVKNIILEPTGVYSIPIIKYLKNNNFKIWIVPTYLVSKYRGNQVQKNDIHDAKILEKYYNTTETQFKKYLVDDDYIIAKKLNILISENISIKKK